MIDTPKLDELVEVFHEATESLKTALESSDEEVGLDAEYRFIKSIRDNLETIQEETEGLPEDSRIAVAASRIVGLLYLYQLY